MTLAEALNLGCMCRTLNPQRLREQLETSPGLAGLVSTLASTHPHLFSQTAVFLDASVYRTLSQTIGAIERVIALPAYQQGVLSHCSAIAQSNFGPAGVFMGYDFHISAQGPRLIEINTNAGGGWLNAALASAHRDCCAPMQGMPDAAASLPQLEQAFMEMFTSEWRSQRGTQTLRSIAIVDDAPEAQYLAPEFELARNLFGRHGIQAVIADARDLVWREGALWHTALPPDRPIDLVYNRLTDFDLSDPAHAALRQAYLAGAAVVTPSPRAHALHAHKSNLITLSDDKELVAMGVSAEDRATLLAAVPRAMAVTADTADALWTDRRNWFFKPVAGYGAKAAYRGDKLTKRVWGEIVAGGFIAQALVPPSERVVEVEGVPTRLKLDVRAYTYRGTVQLLAARTYSGQTTNMRTPGGGFCPVVILPSLPVDKAAESVNPAISA